MHLERRLLIMECNVMLLSVILEGTRISGFGQKKVICILFYFCHVISEIIFLFRANKDTCILRIN